MKIRTEEKLLDVLDKEASWRRKELTMLSFSLKQGRNSNESMHIRSSIALSYAHWEGFIKTASEKLLTYLSFLKIPGDKICRDLRYAYLCSEFNKVGNSTKINTFREFYDHAEAVSNGAHVKLDPKKLISTRSNLNHDVFIEIAERLGVCVGNYETRFPMIDNLVSHRNSIAHGENPVISLSLADEYIRLIRDLIEFYKIDLVNIVSSKKYLKTSA